MKPLLFLLAAVALLTPDAALSCACGCSVFGVGTRGAMPMTSGFSMSLQYNYLDQSRNWSGWDRAPADQNPDQRIRTNFFTFGLQYFHGRTWGVRLETPIWERLFRTIDDDGNMQAVSHSSIGDISVIGMYTGLLDDMSLGIQAGLKVPTGSFTQELFDRDTQIGTGTTDVQIGAYKRWQEDSWGWYAQAVWQHALNTRDNYRPGDSFDMSVGAHFDDLLESLSLVPTVQLIVSTRATDSGGYARPGDTGYERVYVAPGVEWLVTNRLRLYGDIRIPIATHVRGNQLVAPALASVMFAFIW